MSDEEIYHVWAPPGRRWSPWVKPVLFSSINRYGSLKRTVLQPFDASFVPPASKSVAIVIDLPGPEGVFAGISLAHRGYFPVPLYNAMPLPDDIGLEPNRAVVDVLPITSALLQATDVLPSLEIPHSAPPAFLLDATRRQGVPQTNYFDNRSISFPADFPSSSRLISWGINRALLVQNSGSAPQADLAHTLYAWQCGGVTIQVKELSNTEAPAPCMVAQPSRFRLFWYRALESLGFKRNILGGFGGVIGESSSG